MVINIQKAKIRVCNHAWPTSLSSWLNVLYVKMLGSHLLEQVISLSLQLLFSLLLPPLCPASPYLSSAGRVPAFWISPCFLVSLWWQAEFAYTAQVTAERIDLKCHRVSQQLGQGHYWWMQKLLFCPDGPHKAQPRGETGSYHFVLMEMATGSVVTKTVEKHVTTEYNRIHWRLNKGDMELQCSSLNQDPRGTTDRKMSQLASVPMDAFLIAKSL